MKILYILLFFTPLLTQIEQFTLPFRKNNDKPRKSSRSHSTISSRSFPNQVTNFNDETNSLSSYCGEDCPCITCNYTLPAPKKIINPYKQEISNLVPQKPFSSICVKCAACIAVATEIEKVIVSSSEECETDPKKKKKLLQDVVTNINNLCLTGFKNFNLRAYGNHSIITNRFKCTSHLISSMDGNWTKKLRELCSLYISKMNLEDICLNVLDSVANLTETMCRSTGIFRDCSNIKSHKNITMPLSKECNY